MAGVTDRPFRQLCKKFGAGMAVSEMVDMNCFTVESAMKMVAGTARSAGINVTGTAPWAE